MNELNEIKKDIDEIRKAFDKINKILIKQEITIDKYCHKCENMLYDCCEDCYDTINTYLKN